MVQSAEMTQLFYELTYSKVLRLLAPNSPGLWELPFFILFNYVQLWMPFGTGWLHEEWHRSILSLNGIKSNNDIYRFRFFSSTVNVSGVEDKQLKNLKLKNSSDFVRMSSAGIEAQYEFIRLWELHQHFDQNYRGTSWPVIINLLNNILYLKTCDGAQADRILGVSMKNEGRNINERDITGLDCLSWVYDLHRPKEAYQKRGVHPTGVGYKRYIEYRNLSHIEKQFLRKIYLASYVNFFDMFLWYSLFNQPHDAWIAALRHNITSFGQDFLVELFLKIKKMSFSITGHFYKNNEKNFPGLELKIFQLPLKIFKKEFNYDLHLFVWGQPTNLNFYDKKFQFGGLFSIKLFWNYSKLRLFNQFEIKSKGWVAQRADQMPSITTRIGIVF